MKKGLVFGGLGLLFALSMWFIFAPSGKDKTAAEQGLNDSIPQATTEKLTENKLKAYELGDKAHEEEQTREEMGRLSDYFAENTAPTETKRAEAAVSTAKIESSMRRYEENTRLLNSFYAPDPHEETAARTDGKELSDGGEVPAKGFIDTAVPGWFLCGKYG